MTKNDRAEGFRIGVRTQELIEDTGDTPWTDELLSTLLSDAYEAQHIDWLARVVEIDDRLRASWETNESIRQADRQQAAAAASAALNVICPLCQRAAGQRCVSQTGKPAPHLHQVRIKAGNEETA